MKKLLALSLALLFLLFPSAAYGQNTSNPLKVIDYENLFTDSEEAALQDRAAALAEKYDFDIVLMTVEDFGGKTPMEYADDHFDYNDYGLGGDRDGVLLLICVGTGDWYVSTSGRGQDLFNQRISKIEERIVPELRNGDYYEAFDVFLDYIESVLSTEASQNGNNNNNNDDPDPYTYTIWDEISYFVRYNASDFLIIFGITLAIGLITAFSMKAKMNTARKQQLAQEYIKQGSFHLDSQYDLFLYSTQTRTKKETQSSSSGGSHTSSSGRSHGGGGGKF